jgi:hypothetical protein
MSVGVAKNLLSSSIITVITGIQQPTLYGSVCAPSCVPPIIRAKEGRFLGCMGQAEPEQRIISLLRARCGLVVGGLAAYIHNFVLHGGSQIAAEVPSV